MKISALNVFGFTNKEKQKTLLEEMVEKDTDLLLLGETRVNDYFLHGEEENPEHAFNRLNYYSTKPSKKGGVMTIQKQTDFDKRV